MVITRAVSDAVRSTGDTKPAITFTTLEDTVDTPPPKRLAAREKKHIMRGYEASNKDRLPLLGGNNADLGSCPA